MPFSINELTQQIITEALGPTGALLFVKAKQPQIGTDLKKLYVIVIDGIDQRSKQAFLRQNSVTYRVVKDDQDKFKTRTLEVGNKPKSVRLNHNKTPFHWKALEYDNVTKMLNSNDIRYSLLSLKDIYWD